jgi:hypothetical protein
MDALPPPSSELLYGFVTLLVVTIGVALRAVRQVGLSVVKTAAGLALWMALTGALSGFGVLDHWETKPPPMVGVLLAAVVGLVLLARGEFGTRLSTGLPVGLLVGFQAFRFPLELLLHRAYTDGLMPVQMSFEGRNFDIITGIAALVLGVFSIRSRGQLDPRLAWVFNLVGLGLLLNIVGVALASTPTFAAFGPDAVNRWVADLPFVWLPMVFVTFAMLGHVLLTRRLLATHQSETPLPRG